MNLMLDLIPPAEQICADFFYINKTRASLPQNFFPPCRTSKLNFKILSGSTGQEAKYILIITGFKAFTAASLLGAQ